MTYKIHKPIEKPAENPPYELALVPGGSGVDLCVVDADGKTCDAGYLLTIHSNGEVRLHNNVGTKYGFHWQTQDKYIYRNSKDIPCT